MPARAGVGNGAPVYESGTNVKVGVPLKPCVSTKIAVTVTVSPARYGPEELCWPVSENDKTTDGGVLSITNALTGVVERMFPAVSTAPTLTDTVAFCDAITGNV